MKSLLFILCLSLAMHVIYSYEWVELGNNEYILKCSEKSDAVHVNIKSKTFTNMIYAAKLQKGLLNKFNYNNTESNIEIIYGNSFRYMFQPNPGFTYSKEYSYTIVCSHGEFIYMHCNLKETIITSEERIYSFDGAFVEIWNIIGNIGFIEVGAFIGIFVGIIILG